MKQFIRRPWRAVAVAATFVLTGTYLSLSFGQFPQDKIRARPGKYPEKAYSSPGPYNNEGYPERETLSTHEDETRKAIEAYRLTQDEAEKARIAKELPDLVGKQFDARQQIRERELKQLEEQLNKLRELHQRRTKQRDQIVEERVRQLLRDADGLGWGSDDEQPAGISANWSGGKNPKIPQGL